LQCKKKSEILDFRAIEEKLFVSQTRIKTPNRSIVALIALCDEKFNTFQTTHGPAHPESLFRMPDIGEKNSRLGPDSEI
jgi:hypothetical protein